jgi:hypothetical protein
MIVLYMLKALKHRRITGFYRYNAIMLEMQRSKEPQIIRKYLTTQHEAIRPSFPNAWTTALDYVSSLQRSKGADTDFDRLRRNRIISLIAVSMSANT